MSWKCPGCGTNNPDDHVECMACFYLHIPAELTLSSDATGKQLRMRLETNVGKNLLSRLVGDECNYASEVQFKVFRSPELGGWVVQHHPEARNPTFLNAAALGAEPRKLESGSVLSIGIEKARMGIQLSD